MLQNRKIKSINIHVCCVLFAALLCVAAELVTRLTVPDLLPSYYFEDMSIDENAESVFKDSKIEMVHSRLEGRHVYADEYDAYMILTFNSDEPKYIRSVALKLGESYYYDIDAALFYPDADGEYVEECQENFKIEKGNDTAYFTIPEEVDYPMKGIRIDIDEDYVVEDVLVSEKPVILDYRPFEHTDARHLIWFFIIALFALECLYFLAPDILRMLRWVFAEKKSILKWTLGLLLFAILGNLAGFAVFRLTGKDYSWFYQALFGIFSMLGAVELYYLLNKNYRKKHVVSDERSAVKAFFWIVAAGFVLLIGFEYIDSIQQAPEIMGKIRFQVPFFLIFAETILLALLYRKYILLTEEDSISFRNIYMLVVFILGLFYMITFLPFVSPDEPSHYLSAYRISNVLLGKIGQLGDNRLLMRAEDYFFYEQRKIVLNPEYYMQITEGMHPFIQKAGFVITNGPMVTNAIFSYCVTGLGIAVARILRLSADMTFYFGRLFNLLFFLLVMRHLMKKIPFGRTALFAVSVMPLTLHMLGSYTYDISIFCFVGLFVTQVMCMICQPDKISRRDFSLCIFYGILMAPSKLVYIPLLFLVFLIPAKNLSRFPKKARKMKWRVIVTGILSAVLVMVIVNLLGADPAIRKMVEENNSVNMVSWARSEGYTISWILQNPIEYALMCIRTVITMVDYYFFTLIGNSLGWLDVGIQQVCTVISFMLLYLSINIQDDASGHIHIGLRKKMVISAICACTVLITFAAMTLDWTPLSYNYILGVQGRYFIPLMIPVIWLLRDPLVEVKSMVRKKIVLFSTMLNIWILVFVFAQYIVGRN